MELSDTAFDTPKYVLFAGSTRIGPRITKSEAGINSAAIYGFSNRDAYEKFCKGIPLALKPYPLVKGYLQNELDASEDRLLLVVLDAIGPAESCISAAAFQAVLEAQESGAARVSADYQLSLTGETDCYRLNEPCAHLDAPSQVPTLT